MQAGWETAWHQGREPYLSLLQVVFREGNHGHFCVSINFFQASQSYSSFSQRLFCAISLSSQAGTLQLLCTALCPAWL